MVLRLAKSPPPPPAAGVVNSSNDMPSSSAASRSFSLKRSVGSGPAAVEPPVMYSCSIEGSSAWYMGLTLSLLTIELIPFST